VKALRVGVFGGTFNPVHLGHLHIARKIQTLFSLSEIHFVVATVPPHKPSEDLIAFNHRYAMVSLATATSPSFIPSLIELAPQASPFSVDTMEKFARGVKREKGALFFIAGGDSLLEVKTWRESEKLLSSYNFIFVTRPGTTLLVPAETLPEKAVPRVRDFRGLKPIQVRGRIAEEKASDCRIYIVDIGAPDISATRIRTMTSLGKSVEKLVPQSVGKYIRKLRLYGGR
jgi:nicotinate-nucleotide adenylyltransferase